jgi:hypothetical protein
MVQLRSTFLFAALLLGLAAPAAAQRQLSWDRVDVAATLHANGTLEIVETQTMVFDGEWNGGERVFDIRPHQTLQWHGLLRERNGVWREMIEDSSLDDVDDYGWPEEHRLRWRSRLPGDPPFARTVLRYRLHYSLAGILLENNDGYVLDHDFLFPDRDGEIRAFRLQLTLDPAWEAGAGFQSVYSAERVRSGDGFVLTVPLRYVGTGEPAALDTRPSPAVTLAMQVLLGVTLAGIAWLLVRETIRGRFAPLPAVESEDWLRQHVLAHPAEVVGAAWDDGIGPSEVVALLARLVSEGKLTSDVTSRSSMALRLQVDRDSLDGYERELIDKLFFNGRVRTNTDLVKQHYREKGFNPVEEIRAGLSARLDALLPTARTIIPGALTGLLALLGLVLLVLELVAGRAEVGTAATAGFGGLVLMAIGAGVGNSFRGALHRGPLTALLTLVPAFAAVGLTAWFLRSHVVLGYAPLSTRLAIAITAMALAVVFGTLGAMRSRQKAEGVAVRKRLAAARAFFERELEAERPALRDEWFPWLLAFGLGGKVDDWSVRHRDAQVASASSRTVSSGSWTSSETSSASGGWTGFAGGRSGGAGAAASWSTAAGSIAAGVSPPSSSGSSSGGGGSSSSSGGSSGGGGGGGW